MIEWIKSIDPHALHIILAFCAGGLCGMGSILFIMSRPIPPPRRSVSPVGPVSIKGNNSLFPDWYYNLAHGNYWRDDPNSDNHRWHVSKHEANTLGTVRGEIVQADGWYWWTADLSGQKFSSLFGPFTSADAALADCEVAGRPMSQQSR